MTVYVDNARKPYRTMIMCHMTADTLDELLAFADTIGVNRRWLQTPAKRPHFDICRDKRALAVKAGAVEITTREMARRFPANRRRAA